MSNKSVELTEKLDDSIRLWQVSTNKKRFVKKKMTAQDLKRPSDLNTNQEEIEKIEGESLVHLTLREKSKTGVGD